jgi:hypothetical protein
MAFVAIDARVRPVLAARGLTVAADFLDLSGPVVSGHPDRHVRCVRLGEGPDAMVAYLKREHRVPWRDRLASAWAGCGFVSKSSREYSLLRALSRAGIGCPEALAAGEDDAGRAFLLVRAAAGLDLGHYLHGRRDRRAVALQLGAALARLHAAGYQHGDLYAKHVVVQPDDRAGEPALTFLDWQRARRARRLGWGQRWRDLATLDATLAHPLASDRDRLRCLRSYLRGCAGTAGLPSLSAAARAVRRLTVRLLHKRHIREQRLGPLVGGEQNLLWLDGEALCVTREFHDDLRGEVPSWLPLSARPAERLTRDVVPLAQDRPAFLTRRSLCRPLAWLWGWLRRRPLPSPEVQQAATLFRLQRYGVTTPRLLAVGQRQSPPWRTESFLLTEPVPAAVSLAVWLRHQRGRQRSHTLRELGTVLRRIHEASFALRRDMAGTDSWPLLVQRGPEGGVRIVLGSPDQVRKRRRPGVDINDLARVFQFFAAVGSRADGLRFFLSYLGLPRLTPAARRLARAALRRVRLTAPRAVP